MRKAHIIRYFLAAPLMALFAFAITPRIILHDAVAHHKDTPFATNDKQDAQLNNAGFNCNCDNLVVESPFTGELEVQSLHVLTMYLVLPVPRGENLSFIRRFYSKLRGPPTSVA